MTETSPTPAELVQRHQGMVRSIAATVIRSLSSQIEFDDLVAYGQVGLAEAAKGYRSGRGVEFSTYAYHRIRGAMYDGASKLGWYSRAQLRRIRFQEAAEQALNDQRETSQAQPTEPVEKACHSVGRLVAVGLALDAGCDPGWAESLEDPGGRTGEAEASWSETRTLIRAAVAELPAEQRKLIEKVYFEGISLSDFAREVDRDKSWASRTHSKALDLLARSLREQS